MTGFDWQDDALCAQVDPEMFFVEKGGSIAEAKAVCALCDVRAECLATALELGPVGVWGGTSPMERRKLGGTQHASAGPFLPPSSCDTPRLMNQFVTIADRFDRVNAIPQEADSYPGGPRALARQLGLTFPGTKQLSYEQVEDLAAQAYWRNRPQRGPLCGTQRGYDRHLSAGTPTCAECRKAHALVTAVNRNRRQRAAA